MNYYLQFHENGQSPYGYDMNMDQCFFSDTALYIQFGKQIKTIRLNKSNHTCNKDNSNSFMKCLENYYSKKLGCILPWTISETNNGKNVCQGKDKFQEYRNLTMKMLKPEIIEELRMEKCMMENCEQRLWKVRFKDEKESPKIGFFYFIPQRTKVLERKEVKLYTLVNVFADIGGYLGLLLGESILSYLLIGSKWAQEIIKACKEKFGKHEDQVESISENNNSLATTDMPISN